jgi:ribosomal protein S18 acetylase RimI-like enzyme
VNGPAEFRILKERQGELAESHLKAGSFASSSTLGEMRVVGSLDGNAPLPLTGITSPEFVGARAAAGGNSQAAAFSLGSVDNELGLQSISHADHVDPHRPLQLSRAVAAAGKAGAADLRIATCVVAGALLRQSAGRRVRDLPHLIGADGTIVGFSTIVCDPHSEEGYWIDDIMIDATHQGRGYGRAAVVETLRTILKRYPRCRAVQLVCFRGNTNAEALYLSLGFVKTGETDPVFEEPVYRLSGSELDELR